MRGVICGPRLKRPLPIPNTPPPDLPGYRADACIIPEPLPFVMTAQVGVVWMHIETTGKPAHVWDTSAGVNAIEVCRSRFLASVAQYLQWQGQCLATEGGYPALEG